MKQTDLINRRILLASRPQGLPAPENFRIETRPLPALAEGEVLLRTLYLSLDPYMRNVMNEDGPIYAPSISLGEVMVGGTVCRVTESRHPAFQAGDLVLANSGWQDYAVSNGEGLMPLGAMDRPSLALGALGMPAFTAYVGLLDIGQPRAGDTVVVAAATGAVGSIVGQIARIKGARVIGIAGGADKCRHAVEHLGLDACLDHRDPLFAENLAASCPQGIDVYFESVGGAVFDAVLPLLNVGARVPVIGVIAHYNDTDTHLPGPDRRPELMTAILQKRLLMQGLIILDHYERRFDAFRQDMETWLAAGLVIPTEDIAEGLEQAPAAFIGMLRGSNLGKLVVRVSD